MEIAAMRLDYYRATELNMHPLNMHFNVSFTA